MPWILLLWTSFIIYRITFIWRFRNAFKAALQLLQHLCEVVSPHLTRITVLRWTHQGLQITWDSFAQQPGVAKEKIVLHKAKKICREEEEKLLHFNIVAEWRGENSVINPLCCKVILWGLKLHDPCTLITIFPIASLKRNH